VTSLEQRFSDPRLLVRNRAAVDAGGEAVVYWMQRAQRADDNAALDLAIEIGNELDKPVVVFFGLVPFYPHGNWRHYRFLADGLPELAAGLARRRVGFVLRRHPDHALARFLDDVRPCLVVGDENPLREPEQWRRKVAERLRVRLVTVDADVVVPSRLFEREQPGAYTLRPRLRALLPRFLMPSSAPVARRRFRAPPVLARLDPRAPILDGFAIDRSVAPVATPGGRAAAVATLHSFVAERLDGYGRDRNLPELDATSRLSAYLHFGQLGPREVALEVRASAAPRADRDAFLEQLIVRRELAINFVRCNQDYDRLHGCAEWARRTLRAHARDRRPWILDEARAAAGESPDPLWNAAQRQMLEQGFMHSYLRMYWAKKLLEWSPSPERAFELAVAWNDRWQLDGRDPNGYAGIAWAIGGKHDRPWPERAVFGHVRSMTLGSTSKKFDARRYIASMSHVTAGPGGV
jgi:deoxyribodipyrimidine photo-lyase